MPKVALAAERSERHPVIVAAAVSALLRAGSVTSAVTTTEPETTLTKTLLSLTLSAVASEDLKVAVGKSARLPAALNTCLTMYTMLCPGRAGGGRGGGPGGCGGDGGSGGTAGGGGSPEAGCAVEELESRVAVSEPLSPEPLPTSPTTSAISAGASAMAQRLLATARLATRCGGPLSPACPLHSFIHAP